MVGFGFGFVCGVAATIVVAAVGGVMLLISNIGMFSR